MKLFFSENTRFMVLLICFLFAGNLYAQNNNSKGDGFPINRSEVIKTAHTYTRVHWYMSKDNQRGHGCKGNFKSTYRIGHRVGMGYKWGAWDDVKTFLTRIEDGYGTGTGGYVNYKDYSFDCVTGTSCTGLVSRAWRLNHKYTLTYPDSPNIPRQMHEITNPVEGVDFRNYKTSMIKKGDAFMNKSHIILFVYETRDRTAMVIDSGSSGVSFREMSYKELADNGYTAIRYNNIRDEKNPVGTIKNPMIIDSDKFPFNHTGNTRDVASMEFDRYAKDADFNEQGPEFVYELRVQVSGKVLITLDEPRNEGIDNDLYFLKSLKKNEKRIASECLMRGDEWIARYLYPGIYYIVVDSGKDQPGEYRMLVTFAR